MSDLRERIYQRTGFSNVELDAVMAVVGQVERERDEARASVEHLRGDYRRIRKDRDRLLLAWRSACRRANQLRWLHAEAVWQRQEARNRFLDHYNGTQGHLDRIGQLETGLRERTDERDSQRESRFRWAEEAAHLEAEVTRLNALVDWYNKSGTLELANHDRAMDERDARIAEVTSELAALRASAVVLPEDWLHLVERAIAEAMPGDFKIGDRVDFMHRDDGRPWRRGTISNLNPIRVRADDTDNLTTAPEVLRHVWSEPDFDDAPGVSGTGTEAPLADLPEAEWRKFHADATSARGKEARDGDHLRALRERMDTWTSIPNGRYRLHAVFDAVDGKKRPVGVEHGVKVGGFFDLGPILLEPVEEQT